MIGVAAKVVIRFRAHLEQQGAAFGDLRMVEPGALHGLAIEREGLDVGVVGIAAFDLDLEGAALAQLNRGLIDQG